MGYLEFIQNDLKSSYDALAKLAMHGVSLPTEQILNSEGPLDQMFRKVYGNLQDKIRSQTEAVKDAREAKRALRDKLRRELPNVKLPKLEGQATFLKWHSEVKRFMKQNGDVQDNDTYFHSMIFDTLSDDNKKQISHQKISIEYIVDQFTSKYETNITEAVMEAYVKTLKQPGESRQISHGT